MRGRTITLVVLVVTAGAVPGIAGPANEPPRADAGLDRTVRVGETVYLDAGGSVDPDGRIVGYEWSIRSPEGRETIRSGERARFVPNTTGQYAVTVTVRDDDGATRRDTLYVTVRPADGSTPTESPTTPTEPGTTPTDTPTTPTDTPTTPTDRQAESTNDRPRGSLTGPETVRRGETATFRAQVYDPDGRVVGYDWAGGGSGRTTTRTFTEPPGTTVVVAVTARDDDGATRRVTKHVTVVGGERNDPPTARIDGPSYLRVGESGTFRVSGRDPDGRIDRRRWTAPVTADGSTLTRTFDEPGNYTVTAVVWDDDGAQDRASHTVRVVAGRDDPPVASLSGPKTAANGTDAVYEVDATDPDGGRVTVEWLTGGTGGRQTLAPGSGGGDGSRFENRFVITGDTGETITVRARVTDDEGNSVVVSTETRVTDVDRQRKIGPNEPIVRWGGIDFVPDRSSQTNSSDVIRGRYQIGVWVGHQAREPVTVTWTLGNGVEKTRRIVDPNRTVSITHTFLSQDGGTQLRRISVRVTDRNGTEVAVTKQLNVHTLNRGGELRVSARALDEAAGPNDRLTVPPDTTVTFEILSYQPFEIETGDGHTYTGEGTAGTATRTFSHQYHHAGERVAVVTSIDGDRGIRTARITIDVQRTQYTEYRYTEALSRTEETIAVSEPAGDGWQKAEVVDAFRRPTGDRRRVRRGTRVRFPSSGDTTWVKTGTERETVTRTDREVATDSPGPGWSLTDRRVERRTETRTDTQTTWRDSRYDFGVWELVGSQTTREVEYTTATDDPGYGWHRVGDTGRDVRSGYSYTWRDSRSGSGYTGRRDCVRRGSLAGETVCLDYRYQYREPDYEDVYRWQAVTYDTDYRYQRTVSETVTVWAHEWTKTRTETVVYDVYEERESVTEWRWRRNRTVAGDTVWSLDRPPAAAYVDGTLVAFQRRCDRDDGHFDDRVCD